MLQELVGTFFDLLATGRDAQRPANDPRARCPSSPESLAALRDQRTARHRAVALSTREVPITIAPIQSALLRTESREFYRQLALTLRVGEELASRRRDRAPAKHRL